MAKTKAKSKVKAKAPAKKPGAKKVAAKKPAPKVTTPKTAKPAGKTSKAAQPQSPKSFAKTATVAKAPKVEWADFFSPLGNRVLIEREEAPTKTAGGLFIPDFVQERPNQARVLVAGPGSRTKSGRLQPLDVQVGDHVLFSAYAGMPIQLQGQDLLLVKEDEIQAILPL